MNGERPRFWRRRATLAQQHEPQGAGVPPLNGKLLLSAAIASVGGLLFGYNTGIVSALLISMPKEFEVGPMLQGVIVSAMLMGAVLGAAVSGKITDYQGRRDTILGTAAIYALGSFSTAVASTPLMLILGRLIVGVAIGSTSVTVPLYLAEIAPAPRRGMLVSFNQLAITIGILAAFCVGAYVIHNALSWHLIPLLGVAPALLLGIGALCLPESPRWLMLQDDEDKSRSIFLQTGSTTAQEDIVHIRRNVDTTKGMTLPDLFKQPLRSSLLAGIGIFVVQQFTGINAVLYYSPIVFAMAGVESEVVALTAAVSLAVINVLSTVAAMALVDRIGRRPLLLTGLGGMVICLIVLGCAANPSGDISDVQKFAAMASLIGFVASFALGIGVMGWLLIAELFPLVLRGTAMSLPSTVHWGTNLLISLSFPFLLNHAGPDFTFWLFALSGVLGLLFLSSFVPETKGRTLEEIEDQWLAQDQRQETPSNHFRLWLIAGFASLGALITGYELAIIGSVILDIRTLWSLSLGQEGIIVSAFLLGATVAAILSGRLADNFGRRTIVLAMAVFFVTGNYLCGLAPSPNWLIAGRLVIGMSTGVATFAIPMYLSEIAPSDIRGALVVMSQLALAGGGLLAYLVTSVFDVYEQGWRELFTLAAIPSAFLAVAMLFLPESPSWLLLKNDPGAARRMLQRLGVPHPQNSLTAMSQGLSSSVPGKWKDLLNPKLRMPLLIGVVLLMLQQVTGGIVVLNYCPTIFTSAGFESSRAAILASAGLGLVDFMTILLSMRLVDRVGRRPLLLWGLAGTIATLGMLGLAFFLKGYEPIAPQLKWIVAASLILYVASSGMSLGPVGNLIVSELFPLHVRGLGMSIATCASVGSAALMSFSFPYLVAALSDAGVFWLYGLIGTASIVFCYYFAPETKGKTLQEIERHWLEGRSPRELR